MMPWEIYLSKTAYYFQELPPETKQLLMNKAGEYLQFKIPFYREASYDSIKKTLGGERSFAISIAFEMGITISPLSEQSSSQKWAKKMLVVFLLLIVAIYFAIQKYTPIFEIDEQQQKILLFGGEFEIDYREENFSLSINGKQYSNRPEDRYGKIQGEVSITDAQVEKFRLIVDSAQLELDNREDSLIKWDCLTLTKDARSPRSGITDKRLEINFEHLNLKSCKIGVPEDISLKLQAKNASIRLNRPLYDVSLIIGNGKVSMTPHPMVEYNYMIDILNGHHSRYPKAPPNPSRRYRFKVHLDNGNVRFYR